MKKGILITLFSAFVFWGINAQAQGKNYDGLSEFSSINIGVPADVFVTQSANQSVRIETNQSNLEKIEVEVKGGKLNIKSKRNNTHYKGDIKIYISAKKINGLSLAGSGSITTKGKVSAGNLSLSIAGSGTISSLNLSAEELQISVAGSGDVHLAGDATAKNMKVSVAGSGKIKAQDFAVKNIKTSISGSGKCYFYPTDELHVSLSGSGDVYYVGNPLIDARISGSGSVKSIE